MTTVSLATLGCKVNQFESEALMAGLEERGYHLVPFEEGADITIINTCCITHRADFESRQMVRRALRRNPNSFIIVTGCYSQVEPEAFAHMGGVNYLLGNREKTHIPDLLPMMMKGELPQIQVSDIQGEKLFSDISLYTFHHHTRAFLKIQDGCNARCSYCIVPHARGPSRSLPPERVIEHLRVLKERDFKEVVLTGIHIGSYGLELTPVFTLEKLLQRLEVEETPHRIRLSSIEPLDFSADLISTLSRSVKICPHLHIPIQSGDDDILKMMNRNYDHAFLSDLIRELHERIPEVSMGADVIVGFPGETEERFKNTFKLIDSLPLSYLHVFPFSKRKGTPAAQFLRRIDEKTVKQMAERMRDLGREKRRSFYRRFLHQELKVLVEDRKARGQGRWKGFSRNYIPVRLVNGGHCDLTNQECRVVVTEWSEKGVTGKVAEGQHG
ncbi:MAG: tRNA (N(6)-L-threonylcarbamoyladenosine(37)-C(2))-methylthiotransferase MtaB [Thermodesulfobacteriota bacterium]|nr:tRNA (N(6)-L-threonylcarbamoyladenosine(37)-C(2))-methylthiotransferase MtaB [Thermodesulfobacteriota bacterium]